ncbi:hypothetical protein ACFP2T_00390 [Plantactinospora solaniradicis]|uniref:Uncharacterized protein n=1 Tax=Plantactinospora solaniradicis TaxID=1723736 RepID=A0ABW1JZQ1_9ACTN
MASIGEHLDNMVVTVASPDQRIQARVSNYHDIEITFAPGAFDRYDEEHLSHQLGRLGVTTWVAYHRARSEAYRLSQGLSSDELAAAERPTDDPHRRRYEEELNNIEGEGVSPGGAVRIRTWGLMQWNVDVQPGSIQRLGEAAFLGELHSAMKSLLSDREMKIITLKSEYFDIGIPRQWRDLMTELRARNRHRR